MQKFNYCRHQHEELLIDFLLKRFPYQSKESWLSAIKTGAIKVNGKIVEHSYVLINRDVISYERPRESEPEIDPTYNILYQDQHILVVEKSGNLPVAESGRYYRNVLINILKEKEGFSELYTVHRLDKETSGVLVIARTKEVAQEMGIQFSNQIPKKEYHAILNGALNKEEILVNRPLKNGLPQIHKVRIRQIVSPTGKSAKTLFTRVNGNEDLTLTRVKLFSGRTHQIRCHAEYIGHPILGDKLYGQTDKRFIQILKQEIKPEFPPYGIIPRHLLHASSLSFIHPESKKEVSFYSDCRKEFSKFPALDSIL